MQNPRWSTINLSEFKIIFVAIGLVGVLLIASPAIASFVQLPGGERFSELYILGPQHTASGYPSALKVGEPTPTLFVGVTNDMGSSQLYSLSFKLANRTDPLPDQTIGSPSPIQQLFNYRMALVDNATKEYPVRLEITNASHSTNQATLNSLEVNGMSFNINKPSLISNDTSRAFYYRFIVELWIYNSETQLFEYNNRFVYLQLQLDTS